MKAILNHDIIVHLTESAAAVEIGQCPKNVGQERLRFDGAKVIDLADLSEIWVKPLGGSFYELHCLQVPGAQLVNMTYTDRKRLINDNGTIRVKTMTELDNERLQAENLALKNRLRQRLTAKIGDQPDQLADLNKIVAVLAVYVMTGNSRAGQMLTNIVAIVRDMYNPDAIEASLKTRMQTLKDELTTYQQEKQ